MSAGEDPVVVAFPAPDVFPIGTRVACGIEHGTVRAWSIAPDVTWYVVVLDNGARIVAATEQLERARPHAAWRPTLVHNKERS